ncbi:MAG: hypothetical protein OCC49_16485 [Fibrobacterales bacterium]
MTDTILQFAVTIAVVIVANYFLLKSFRADREVVEAPILAKEDAQVRNFLERDYIVKIKKKYTHPKIGEEYRYQ